MVEVLAAITIFAISLLAIIPLLITAVNVDKESFLKVKAQTMLSEKMDELLSQSVLTIGEWNDVEDDGGFTLEREWKVTADTGNLRKIKVGVNYTYKGVGKKVEAVVKKGL